MKPRLKRTVVTAVILAAICCIVGVCHERHAMRMANSPVAHHHLSKAKQDAAIEAKIDELLPQMTIREKVGLLHAQSKFSSAGVPRLGIPELWCTDGPHGIRAEVLWDEWRQAGWTNDSCVAFPALTNLAASWDLEMSALYGKSIGEEARYREKDVLLGPGVNIYRTPLNGRNFEYMGEDPFLSSKMVVPYIQEVQKNGVATCVKHFALNNSESHRHTVDVEVSDRALYEIYLPAFKAAVQEGGSWSIMSSYNLFRGRHVGQDTILTKRILKDEWGFDGAVISDWGAVSDTEEAIESGLDIEFGSWTDGLTMGKTNAYDSYFLADGFIERLEDGRASVEQLDEKARRVLRLILRTAMNPYKPYGSLCSDEHYAAARKIAGAGIVLLKNDNNVLPIAPSTRNILVVGENATKVMTVGGGSSSLKVRREILPLQGLQERAGEINVVYERGYVGSNGVEQDGLKVAGTMETRTASQLCADAVAAAAKADLVIFVGGLNKDGHQDCEGADRLTMDLPYNQNELISALAEVNPNIAVVLLSGNAVSMPWVDKVPTIVQGWYGGSEAGHALADVLFGDVNPSGKLPFTFPVQLSDSPAHYEGKAFPAKYHDTYDEGIYVGYRWFEHMDIKPLFAFGHGLSYTTFEYGAPKISSKKLSKDGKITVSVPVTNTGDRDGSEIVQLYITAKNSSVDRPEKELKGFCKFALKAGETKVAKISFDASAISYFDEASHSWVAEKGEYVAKVAAASDDVKSELSFRY